MSNLKAAESLTKNVKANEIKEMFKHMTVFIEHPNSGCVKIEAPSDFDNSGEVVHVVTSEGMIYTAHMSRVLIIVEPKEQTEGTNEN